MNEKVWLTNRPVRLILVMVLLAVSLSPWVAQTPVQAQDGKQKPLLSWADAPLPPRHRSQADWLVDVGWETADDMYGPFPTHEYQVGDTEDFIPLGSEGDKTRVFMLAERTPHAYFWFERGSSFDSADLEYTADFFENHIWPLNHDIYGEEWNPGIDGDSRIHVVAQSSVGYGIMGAFNPEDLCPRSVCPESNQREVIYISLDTAPFGSDEFLTTLAHEHQHLIQYHVDGNEQRWFNEGLSQLAEHLNGFHPDTIGSYNMIDYLNDPDHSLNGWSVDGYDLGIYYGAGYLFMVYLYERFGLDFMRLLVQTDYDGLAAVQGALVATGQTVSVDQVFADWILANYLDSPYAGSGQYYYQSLDLPNPITPAPLHLTKNNTVYNATVHPYGADYLSLREAGDYKLSFDGSDSTQVIETTPHSGDWMWWSYNNGSSAARLTGAFDLTGLATATLTFNAWWNVEDDFDWFQVVVSDDGGQTWELVNGERSALAGEKAPGAYYSGDSMSWIEEKIDLSAYAGKSVLIRFEYLTDNSVTLEGVALDNIRLIELDTADNTEQTESVWKPNGFLRVPDTVPQHWSLAVVVHGPEKQASVQVVTLDDLNTGRVSFTIPEGGSAAVVIGGMAPFTTIPAAYKIAVQRN
ncbi:MAG: immune inhibitor A [Chloroflexi bacterium]|nr:immune inhibitor A [Chloroflexota bacterium]